MRGGHATARSIALGHCLMYKRNMKPKSVLDVLLVAAIVVAPAIISQAIWPAATKWGFMYSLGFSLIGGIALGILVEYFRSKRKPTAKTYC